MKTHYKSVTSSYITRYSGTAFMIAGILFAVLLSVLLYQHSELLRADAPHEGVYRIIFFFLMTALFSNLFSTSIVRFIKNWA